MIELRFDREIYLGTSVDEAVKVYEKFARFELEHTDAAFVVRLEAKTQERERKIAGELGNYALGLTLRARGQS